MSAFLFLISLDLTASYVRMVRLYLLFETGASEARHSASFALFPSKKVSSDNVGCSIINAATYKNMTSYLLLSSSLFLIVSGNSRE